MHSTAEDFLIYKKSTQENIDEASNLASNSANPISDVRWTSEYRKKLVKVLTSRTLSECIEDSR